MLLDNRKLKFMCVCAYMHNEILTLEEIERTGKGERVIEDGNKLVENTILSIKSIIEKENYTYETIKTLNEKLPQVKFYYDSISSTIKKYVKNGEPWIPSIVILSVLQEFTFRGYKIFEFIPFIEAIDSFIIERNLKASPYLKIAGDIYETMIGLTYKKNKKSKK